MLRLFAVVVASLSVLACDESPTRPSAPLDAEFVLAPGDTAAISGTGLSVRFVRVSNDSRCPGDALCVTAGNALVQIDVRSPVGVYSYELHTSPNQPARHGDVTLSLVQLSPYPFLSQGPIRHEDYRATLRATR